MNFNPSYVGNSVNPQVNSGILPIPMDVDANHDLSSFSLPGFDLTLSEDGSLLTLGTKSDGEYSQKAVQQLSAAIKGLPIAIRLCVKSDIFSENADNATHFFSHFGPKVKELIIIGGIWSAPVNDKVVQNSLSFCPNVERVDCSWGDGITGEFIAHLPHSVKTLKIGTCRTIQEKYFSALKDCKGLETFWFQNYISREDGFFGHSTPDFKGTFIKDLPPSLRSLTLVQFEFDEKNLLDLGKLSKLEHLAFELCIYLKGTFIEHLNPELVSLDLNGCKAIKNENLRNLAGFKKLSKVCCPKSLSPAVDRLALQLQNCKFIQSRW